MKRSIKIEATGDFYLNKVKPKIRLSGRWLEAAGFRPGARVTVTLTTLGQLVLTSEDIQCSQIPLNSASLESEKLRVISRISAAVAAVQQTHDL